MPMPDIKGKIQDVFNTLGKPELADDEIIKQLSKINNILPLDPLRKVNWIDVMVDIKKSNKDQKNEEDINSNSIISDFVTKELTNVTIDKDRIARYNAIHGLRRKVPVLGRALRVWIDNIISPDDFTSKTLNIICNMDNAVEEKVLGLKDHFRNIIKYIKLEDHLEDIILPFLEYGDSFIEIVHESESYEDEVNKHGLIALTDNINPRDYSVHSEIIESGKNKIFLNLESAPDFPVREETYTMFIEDEEVDDKDKVKNEMPKIVVHNPHNGISLTKGKYCYGYLVVDDNVKGNNDLMNQASFTGLDGTSSGNASSEKSIIDDLVAKIYKTTKDWFQSNKNLEVPASFKNVIINVLRDSGAANINVRYVKPINMVHAKIPSIEFAPYGESIFQDLLFDLRLHVSNRVTDIIYKLARAGKHLIFYVDVTGARDAKSRIDNVKTSVNKREVTASDLMSIENIPSIVSTFENFYIPTTNGKKTVEIDTVEFGTKADNQEENKFNLKNILTGIEIPPSILGVEDATAGKNTLSQENVLFANSVIRYQNLLSKYLTELVQKIYVQRIDFEKDYKNYDDLYLDLKVTFNAPFSILVSSSREMFDSITSIINMLKDYVPEEILKTKYLHMFDWEYIEKFKMQEKLQGKKKQEKEEGSTDDFEYSGGEEEEAGGDLESLSSMETSEEPEEPKEE